MASSPPPLLARAANHLRLTLSGAVEDPGPVAFGERIVRFRDPRHADRPLDPNPALVDQLKPTGPMPASFLTRPRFRTAGLARQEITLAWEPGLSLYGTGEVAGPLRRNGTRATNWNTDAFGYSDRSPSLYQSHPWVLGVRADGGAFGIMAETTHRCLIDLSWGVRFVVDGAPCSVLVIERDHPGEVVEALAELTGKMPMPPRWALGYQQCRWSYYPDSEVKRIAEGFRERDIPCDVIWLDIDYMDGFRCFTFDDEGFPDPDGLNEFLHERGFKSVWMIDPGIKVDEAYAVYRDGRDGGHFVSDRNGREYHGRVWPGPCAFPDFTRRRTREWWSGLYDEFMAHGIDGVWNDMNEPAVFKVKSKTMPESNLHEGDGELGGAGTHAKYHNLYGMQMVRATREGIARANPDKRPFVLTRANFLGGQRYAATWTGDNLSTWEHLRWSIPMALNLGLSGQPFAGPDIGGFGRRATPKLFARWMGIGTLLPFARAHTNKYLDPKADGGATSGDEPMPGHEPWSFGDECERICRLAINRRYRLLPYLYTLFREAAATGLPVVRPLFFLDPADPGLRRCDDSFLLGSDVLVRAGSAFDGECTSPMPTGEWKRFEPGGDDLLAPTDPELPRLFVRPGAVVPLGPVMRYSGEKPVDPLTLVVNLDGGSARGTLYEDEGDGFGYERGDYRLSTYEARREGSRVVVEETSHEGERAKPRREEIVVELR